MDFKKKLQRRLILSSFLFLMGVEAASWADEFRFVYRFQNGSEALFKVDSEGTHRYQIQYSPQRLDVENLASLPISHSGNQLAALEFHSHEMTDGAIPTAANAKFLNFGFQETSKDSTWFYANRQRYWMFQDGTITPSCQFTPRYEKQERDHKFNARIFTYAGEKYILETFDDRIGEFPLTTLMRIRDSKCLKMGLRYSPEILGDGVSFEGGNLEIPGLDGKIDLTHMFFYWEIQYQGEIYELHAGKYQSTDGSGETTLTRKRDGKSLKVDFKVWDFASMGSDPTSHESYYQIENGILKIHGINKKVDLDRFDAEVRRFNHIRQADPVLDQNNRPKNVVEAVNQNYKDLVADSQRNPQEYLEKSDPRLVREIAEAIRAKRSVAVLGKAGTGKSSAIRAFAREVGLGNVTGIPRTTQIFQISVDHLVSGTEKTGMINERVGTLIGAAQETGCIYFFDEMHNMAGAGTSKFRSNDITQSFKGPIEMRQMVILGTDTTQEFNDAFASDRAFYERFEQVVVNPAQGADLIELLQARVKAEFGVELGTDLIEKSIQLSTENAITSAQPRAAVNLLRKAFARAGSMGLEGEPITLDILKAASIDLYRFDPALFSPALIREKLERFNQVLNQTLIGQATAKAAVKSVWLRHFTRTGSIDQVNTVLLAGPSGVGKTRLAKVSADAMGYESTVIEMNRFSKAGPRMDAVSQVRKEIYDALLKNSHHVIILDEFETAEASVQNSILSMIESGEFTVSLDTGAWGSTLQEVNARNALFILTTNAGAHFVSTAADKAQGKPNFVDEEEFRAALQAGGISSKVLSRILRAAPMYLPTEEEFVKAVEMSLDRLLVDEGQKAGVTFQLKNREGFLAYAKRQYGEKVDYRFIRNLLMEVGDKISESKLDSELLATGTVELDLESYRETKRKRKAFSMYN